MSLRRRHVAATFCFGLLAGAFLYGVWVRHLHHRRHDFAGRRARVLDKFSRELDLSQGQRGTVKTILEKKGKRYHALYHDLRDNKTAVRKDARAEIRALLSDEQKTAFKSLTDHWDERRRERRKNGTHRHR